MLLAIDAGNTNTVFSISKDGGDPISVWRIRTEATRTSDEYASWLFPLFQASNADFNLITAVIVSSVVPNANFHLRKFCRDYLKTVPICIGDDGIDLGIAINLPKPEEVGADRIVNAVAVKALYQLPAVIVDFGTATTFDVVSSEGAYCGGVIAPGVNLSLDALHRAAAKLPKIDIIKPDKVIGTDTISAMQSGIFWGYAAMIEGLLARMEKEIGTRPYVIATGGLSGLFKDHIDRIDHVDADLTLRGLEMIYAANKNILLKDAA